MTDYTADEILETIETSGVNLGNDRIVGIYGEVGAGFGVQAGIFNAGVVGGEGVAFVGVDRLTGDVVVTGYGGAIFGPSMTLLGPVVGGAGVFGFDGAPEEMRGFSVGAQASAIASGGFSISVPNGNRLQFYGGNNSVGMVVNAGAALSQSINGETVYVRPPTELEREWSLWHSGDFFDIQAVAEAFMRIGGECFLPGTLISMSDGSEKPIEEVAPDDWVTSYDQSGKLVPGRVTRVFQNHAKHILDVFGLHVTPGHVTYCGGGRFEGQHVPMIDILRSDGVLVRESGQKIRAATNEPVGSPKDSLIWACTGEQRPDGSIKIRDRGQLRLGTRFITAEGYDVSIADLILGGGAMVSPEGLVIKTIGGAGVPFYWPFTAMLPRPEDYVLQRSALTLGEIYQADEWEAVAPQMPPPVMAGVGEGAPARGEILRASPAPTPVLPHGPAQPATNRKQRKAQAAQQRKIAKRLRGPSTLH